MSPIKKISVIGAGCVGSFFAREFFKKGFEILEIISRRKESAEELAEKVNAKAVFTDFTNFDKNADLYVMSVKDEVIMELRNQFVVDDKIIVHTSGSMSMEVFKKSSSNYGILYPLQTIIKERALDIAGIPFFVTANNSDTLKTLEDFARIFSSSVTVLEDEKRVKLHLAAVFASNFTNYQLKIASEIMRAEGLDFNLLKPLVEESVARAFDVGPEKSQTGPAKRGDCNITDKHKELLEKQTWKKLYGLLSDMIREDYKKTKK